MGLPESTQNTHEITPAPAQVPAASHHGLIVARISARWRATSSASGWADSSSGAMRPSTTSSGSSSRAVEVRGRCMSDAAAAPTVEPPPVARAPRAARRRSAVSRIRYSPVKTKATVKIPAANTIAETWMARHHESRIGMSGPGSSYTSSDTPMVRMAPRSTKPISSGRRSFHCTTSRPPSTTVSAMTVENSNMLPSGGRPAAMERVTMWVISVAAPPTVSTVAMARARRPFVARSEASTPSPTRPNAMAYR